MSCPDFYSAVQNDDKVVLAWLCKKKKEDIDEKDVCGRTPLWVASYNNNTDIVNLLISSGADINRADNYGITPLHNASRYGNTNIMALLISSGADINQAADNGDTPLIFAALENRMSSVRLLVESGADITIRGDENKTTDEWAMQERHTEIAKFLQDHWNFHMKLEIERLRVFPTGLMGIITGYAQKL